MIVMISTAFILQGLHLSVIQGQSNCQMFHCQEWLNPQNHSGSRWSERRRGVGGGRWWWAVPMSDGNVDVYPLSLSFKVLDENYFIPLEKVPIYFVFSK